MIDIFSIVLTHGLIVLVAWQLLARDDLDEEPVVEDDRDERPSALPRKRPWLANQKYLKNGHKNRGRRDA